MKKTIVTALISIILFTQSAIFSNNLVYASSDADCPGKWDSEFGCPGDLDKAVQKQAATNTTSASSPKTVIVTEFVPGADCIPYDPTSEKYGTKAGSEQSQALKEQDGDTTNTSIATRKYKCTIQPGFGSFQTMFAQIIRWFVFIVMLLGVLGIVGLGIAWAWAGGDDVKAKSSLKKWGINIAIGLIILFFFRYILTIIAPWIYN